MENHYAFSVTYGYRAIFMEKNGHFFFTEIGPHDDVY